MTKQCADCGSSFIGKRSNAIYCSPVCGNRTRSKRHYALHPEELEAKRKLDNSNVPVRIVYRVKSRAKLAGIPFNLTPDDIVIPDVCPVLGIPLRHKEGKQWSDRCPSVDRLRPELGYTKGNIRIISTRANLLKSNASELELTAVLMDFRKLQREGLV